MTEPTKNPAYLEGQFSIIEAIAQTIAKGVVAFFVGTLWMSWLLDLAIDEIVEKVVEVQGVCW